MTGGPSYVCYPDASAPTELYRFSYQFNFLYYTSGAETVYFGGNAYVPYPIRRTGLKSEASSIDQTLEITAFRDLPPAQLFRVQAPSAIVNLTVYRKTIFDDYSAIWIGRVLNAAWITNNEVKLQCESDLSSMRRLSLRRRYQLGCSYALYGKGCNLNPYDFSIDVDAPYTGMVSGRQVTIPATVPDWWPAYNQDQTAYPNNYFAGGYLEYWNDALEVQEDIAIRSSVANVLQLALTPYGLPAAVWLSVFPGCNHTTAVCKATFDNLDNFGGQPLIPKVNPFAATALF